MVQVSRLGIVPEEGIKAPFRVETDAPITLEGNQIIRGYQTVSGNRVLVKDQVDASENGLYNTLDGEWKRASDMDRPEDVQANVWMVSQETGLLYEIVIAPGTYWNPGATDINFTTPSGLTTWGGIGGTLSDQTDLQAALDAKANLTGATFTGSVQVASAVPNYRLTDTDGLLDQNEWQTYAEASRLVHRILDDETFLNTYNYMVIDRSGEDTAVQVDRIVFTTENGVEIVNQFAVSDSEGNTRLTFNADNTSARINYSNNGDIIIQSEGTEALRISDTSLDATFAAVVTARRFQPTGGIPVAGTIMVGEDATNGLVLSGQGLIGDVTIFNDLAQVAAYVPTGTQNFTVNGLLRAQSGLNVFGDVNIVEAFATLVMGADSSGGNQLTDLTNKQARTFVPHYLNAEENMTVMFAQTTVTANTINYGGATSLGNAATQHRFYAAADNVTPTGTLIVQIDDSGMSVTGDLALTGGIDQRADGLSATILSVLTDYGTQTNRFFQIRTPAVDGAGTPFTFESGNAFAFVLDGTNRFDIDSAGNSLFTGNVAINSAGGTGEPTLDFQQGAVSRADIAYEDLGDVWRFDHKGVGTINFRVNSVNHMTMAQALTTFNQAATFNAGITAKLNLNTQTGTTYGFVIADADKMVTLNNAAAITATIPANASVAYPIGTKLNMMQLGAGQVTIAITTDTLNVEAGLTLSLKGQYAVATALKVTSTSWVLFGNLATV